MSKIQQTQQTHSQAVAKANKPQQPQRKPFNPAQMLESPETMRSEDVLAAQQTVGNQVVQRALDKDDRRKGLTDNQGNLRQDLNEQIQQKRGGGTPLPENIQKEASKKLGRNFKDVRIHTDESADKLSRTISARAFTIGKDIFFKNGVFAPGSSAGRETIIHELTHVVQQGGKGGASGALKLGAPDTAQEKEADRIGKKHAASVSAAPAGAVQREGEEDELMMQEDEEELQMQEDEEELQMQEEEEELQMQGEQDELQMQTDVSGVVQRHETGEPHTHDEDGDVPPASASPASKPLPKVPAPKALTSASPASKPLPKVPAPKALTSASSASKPLPKVPAPKALTSASPASKPLPKVPAPKALTSASPASKPLPKVPAPKTLASASPASKPLPKVPAQPSPTPPAKKTADDAKKEWIATLKDPKASKEDIEKAKERLGTFHKDVGKKDFKAAKNERRGALEEAAKSGDDEAYEKWQSERKKTKGEKAKGFFKSAGKKVGSGLLSAGKWTGGKALGFAKGKLNEGVNHFLGTKDDDKDDDKKDEDKGKATGGGGGTSEMIAELYQENKKLKEELAGLKKTA